MTTMGPRRLAVESPGLSATVTKVLLRSCGLTLIPVVSAIRSRPPAVNLIATGRDAPAELTELADTVTEMRKQKHAFDHGVRAIRGIDF